MAVRACVAAVFDKRELGVRWSQNVVVIQVDGRVKFVESHFNYDAALNRLISNHPSYGNALNGNLSLRSSAYLCVLGVKEAVSTQSAQRYAEKSEIRALPVLQVRFENRIHPHLMTHGNSLMLFNYSHVTLVT
jgi:hypothetical protein